jgi:CubicO group peptidase (beta-lactamase class C family)
MRWLPLAALLAPCWLLAAACSAPRPATPAAPAPPASTAAPAPAVDPRWAEIVARARQEGGLSVIVGPGQV